MSTQFTNRQWRLPNNENKDKQSNYSMDFDGNGVLQVDNFQLTNNTDTCSYSAWINIDSSATGVRGIFGKGKSGANFEFNVRYYTGGTNLFIIQINGTAVFENSSLSLTTDTWHHIVVVIDRNLSAGNNIKLFVNNAQITNESSVTFAQFTSTGYPLYIGAESDTATSSRFKWVGQIDAVAIYNYALTDGTGGTVNQIAALYGSSSTGIGNPMSLSPKPVAYYPLGDQDAFNGADYLVPNSSLKDYVFGFNGSNGYVDYGYTALTAISGGSSTLTTSMTISIWFKLNNATSEKGLIYFGDLNNNYGGFTIRHYASKFNFLRGSSHIITGGYSFTDTTSWHNMTLVYDPTNASNCYLYIDGSDTGVTFNASVGNIDFLNSNLSQRSLIIGTYYNTSYIFNGEISNVQIFNSALPETGSNSVETLYNNGSPLTSMSGFSSLQGWWKLDASATYDSSTTTWTIPDDSTNSNDGTSFGMTQANLVQSDLSFKTSISPFALDFDAASSDYIDCGDSDDFSFGDGTNDSPFSYSTWVNMDDATSFVLFSKYPDDNAHTKREYRIFISNADKPYLILYDAGTTSLINYRVATNAITSYQNQWINLTFTYDGRGGNLAGDGIKIYLNGSSIALDATISSSYVSMHNTSTPARIGRTSTSYANGKISNCSLWSTELTPAQVTELYNEGVPSNLNNHSAYSNLVSWWQLGSNTSWVNPYWIALDEKGTNNGQSQNVAAPNNMGESAIVDGVGSYANGVSSGMSDAIVGDAFGSSANSLSYNMDVLDRTEDTPS